MTRRIILLGLVCGVLASSTGCRLLQCVLCPTAACQPQNCGPVPGPACGPACPPACEPACGPASVPVCNPSGGAPAAPCGPLTWVFGLFTACGGCYGDGCGETYYGHFAGDPPDCCDPCDRWGNYTGGGIGGYSGGYVAGTTGRHDRVEAAPEIVQKPRATTRR